MRPDLVKRMVLDGVSDSESYFNDVLQWGRDGMVETHKVCRANASQCLLKLIKYGYCRHSLGFSRLASTLVLSTVLSQFLQISLGRPKL